MLRSPYLPIRLIAWRRRRLKPPRAWTSVKLLESFFIFPICWQNIWEIEGVVSDNTKNVISAVESLQEVYYSELSFSMSNFHFAQGMKIYVSYLLSYV